jgi:hypothetical protein
MDIAKEGRTVDTLVCGCAGQPNPAVTDVRQIFFFFSISDAAHAANVHREKIFEVSMPKEATLPAIPTAAGPQQTGRWGARVQCGGSGAWIQGSP